jgi:uncharacterized protein Yka (UPF0111/DUF47 family)
VTHGSGRWFLPEASDVLARLAAQVEVTVRGVDAFAAWGRGDIAAGESVRAAEHEADARKRELVAAVRSSFTTPLEPEDLFDLSRGLDDVLNGAKNAVREAEALAMAPDGAMAEMCAEVADGVRHLQAALAALGVEHTTADAEAAAAIKAQRNLERTYRAAMSQVIEQDDLREILARQELYRRLTRISDAVVAVADRVMYATVREG